MTRSAFLAFLVVAFLQPGLPGIASAADVYRWVDDEGVVHFTQNPPNDRDSVKVDAANPPADDPETQRERIEQLNEDTTTEIYKRRLEREAKAEERARTAQLAERCAELRDKRNKLANSPKVRARTDDGSYRVLPYEERQQKLAEYDRMIADRCEGN